jgi:nucleotide-binding universal stress UspA family protein
MTKNEAEAMETPKSGARILVPLDGSALAERALPAAERLARAIEGTLLLVRVNPFPAWITWAPSATLAPETYQHVFDNEQRLAKQYLDAWTQTLRSRGLTVDALDLSGEPASTLLDLLPERDIGLVVMTTHGRTGLARFALGSVADRLVRGSNTPVLLIRALTDSAQSERLQRALVPLDGSGLAEATLGLVAQLAGRLLSEVQLVRVVVAAADEDVTKSARTYLDDAQRRLEARLEGRTCAISQIVSRGDPAERILQAAAEGCDVIVMATQGATGARRWAFGSVADRVLQQGSAPMLLVRPQVA